MMSFCNLIVSIFLLVGTCAIEPYPIAGDVTHYTPEVAGIERRPLSEISPELEILEDRAKRRIEKTVKEKLAAKRISPEEEWKNMLENQLGQSFDIIYAIILYVALLFFFVAWLNFSSHELNLFCVEVCAGFFIKMTSLGLLIDLDYNGSITPRIPAGYLPPISFVIGLIGIFLTVSKKNPNINRVFVLSSTFYLLCSSILRPLSYTTSLSILTAAFIRLVLSLGAGLGLYLSLKREVSDLWAAITEGILSSVGLLMSFSVWFDYLQPIAPVVFFSAQMTKETFNSGSATTNQLLTISSVLFLMSAISSWLQMFRLKQYKAVKADSERIGLLSEGAI